jgi:2-polyprenyl-3-methyl-5-hydroxy-6-metoxy-1,4-benzoquinol methylase
MSDLPLGIDWHQLYKDTSVEAMPWFFEPLDPDIEGTLKLRRIPAGAALDIGTGPGTQAIELAKRGFTVTATDLSEAAVQYAKTRAEQSGITVSCVVDNVLKSAVSGMFDLIVDRGCFHVLPPAKRGVYIEQIERWIKPGGFLLLKCFSPLETRAGGPHRVTHEELIALFAPIFYDLEIVQSSYQGTLEPAPIAWFAVGHRRS